MTAFLTADELRRITGRKRFSAQCRVLRERGIRFVAAASGEPMVRPEWLDDAGKPAHRRGHRWDMIGGTGATVAAFTRPRR